MGAINEVQISNLLNMEWLETNGLGGYASSSIIGANTRKYHGLLVASYNPPTERKILVAKVEERILQNGGYYDLSMNQYPGTIHPKGYQFFDSFVRRPLATWIYSCENWKLQKKVFMAHKSNTTVVIYENLGNRSFELELHPLFENKDYHATSKENYFDFYYEAEKSNIKIHAYPNSPALYMGWSKGMFNEYRSWYKNIELAKELYRGQDHIEDYYRIGYLKVRISPKQKVSLIFTTDETMVCKKVAALEKKAVQFVEENSHPKIKDTFYNDLLASGSQFMVDRGSTQSKTIIAGYHWFTDWGRDTMIAMRGLTIATGNQEASKSILSTFFKYLDKGMLPNRFPDYDGQAVEYNTIDATLWLFVAMYEYAQKFKDRPFIEKHLKDLESVLLYHINGTRFNIHLTDEGFISGGQEGWQLTWMDARVDGHVVTPRIGAPVEINALWYNAMCIYEYFCKDIEIELHQKIKEVKKKFTANFKKRFLNENGYLFDVVSSEQGGDTCFRPNQIYAISLPFPLLNKTEGRKILKLVGEKLYTDYGLRTLDKDNPQFVGHYGGNQWERDIAYHQGTVWPFLFMEYWEAYLKMNNDSEKAKKYVVKALEPLRKHFYGSECIHGISEIFDGESPSAGRGCVQQAWSVAALIKLYAQHQLYNF